MTKVLPVDIHREVAYRLVSPERLRAALGLGFPEEAFGVTLQDNTEFLEQTINALQEMEPFTPPIPKHGFDTTDLLDQPQIVELLRHAPEEGHRFSREHETVWYSGYPPETSVEEVAYHMWNELQAQNEFEESVEYHELIAEVSGTFCDLRPRPDCTMPPELHPDPQTAYPAGQVFADRVRDAGLDGIIYESVRHPSGTCIAVFNLGLIAPVRLGASWTITWRKGSKHKTDRSEEVPSWLPTKR